MSKRISEKKKLIVVAIVMQLMFFAAQGQAKLRKIKVGDKMPVFSLPDEKGGVFTYPHKRKVMVVIFLSDQKQSKLAVTGIEEILSGYEEKSQLFDVVAVINEPNNTNLLNYLQMQSFPNYHILIAAKFELWGKLGLIAMPTTLISDRGGNVAWIKAGYGYDFVPSVKQNLNAVLDNNEPFQSSVEVRTLVNTTTRARVTRHLQMAKMLEKKGRIKAAIEEVGRAAELDPNSISTALTLGSLYCKSGKSEDAVKVVAKLEPESRSQKAELNLILGWANRQSDNLDAAEKYLLEAVELNPKSARSLYELGKIYESKGDMEKAATSYRKALAKFFNEPD